MFGYVFSWPIFSLCHIYMYSLQIVREWWETFQQGALFALVYMNKALKMVMEKILISHDRASYICTFGLTSCIISENIIPVGKVNYCWYSMSWTSSFQGISPLIFLPLSLVLLQTNVLNIKIKSGFVSTVCWL